MIWTEVAAMFILAGVNPRGQSLQGPDQHFVNTICGRPARGIAVFQHCEQNARIQRRPVYCHAPPSHHQDLVVAMATCFVPVHAHGAQPIHGIGPGRARMGGGPYPLDSRKPFLTHRRVGQGRLGPEGSELVGASEHVCPQVRVSGQGRKDLVWQVRIVRPRPHAISADFFRHGEHVWCGHDVPWLFFHPAVQRALCVAALASGQGRNLRWPRPRSRSAIGAHPGHGQGAIPHILQIQFPNVGHVACGA